MKSLSFALLLLLSCSLPVAAASSVWLVEKDGERAYLGGTSHLLRPSDYPLPSSYAQAYDAAEATVFEVNPGLIDGPQFQQAVMEQAFYPDGRGLDQFLDPATYRRLAAVAAKAGIEPEAVRRMKPAMVALALLSVELNRLGVTQKGVDFHFYRRAVDDGKPVAALETPQDQVKFLFRLGEGEEEDFLRYMLADIDRTSEVIDPMIDAWRDGDAAALDRLALQEMRQRFPDVYDELIAKRNDRWQEQIEELIASPPTELILVGVGHLVGEDGLLRALEAKGYRVTQQP